MVLQIDVFAQYGVGGSLDVSLNLPSLLTTPANTSKTVDVAGVDVRVVPYASAGLGAFVGAGVDLGPISATIGIEGRITLAEISAPIFAGVGLSALVLPDSRTPPPDVLAAVVGPTAYAFEPKSYKFFATYDYGVGLDINNVLSGEINGRLRIKFFGFSRTWRKRVVKFNGWSKHFDLISGGSDPKVSVASDTVGATLPTTGTGKDTAGTSTNVAGGKPTLGITENQVPLMILQRLTAPGATDGGTDGGADGGVVSFDAGAVQSMFYDNLCCAKVDELCQPSSRPLCCPGMTCVVPPPPADAGIVLNFGRCQTLCKNQGESCTSASDCCASTDSTKQAICDSLSDCSTCSLADGPCQQDTDCCDGAGLVCDTTSNTCKSAPQCAPVGTTCESYTDCCQPDPSTNQVSVCVGEIRACEICGVGGGSCNSDNDCCTDYGYSCDLTDHTCVFSQVK
jgi:hypothetical protein